MLLLVTILSTVSFTLHKEYFSLTKIDFNEKDQALQITMRIFTNDIDLALSKQFEKAIELGTTKEIANADKLLEIYLNQKFSVKLNKQMARYTYIGKEFEKDVMYVYLEITDIKEVNEIEIQAAMLIETFAEQENIVKLNINEQRKSLILTQQNDKGLLKFDPIN